MANETYSEVRCDFLDDENFWSVDAWRTSDDNEEGKVVAVIHEKYGDVYYIEPEARLSPKVQEVVNSFVNEIHEREIKRIADDFLYHGHYDYSNTLAKKVSKKLTELAKSKGWDLLWLENTIRDNVRFVHEYIFG